MKRFTLDALIHAVDGKFIGPARGKECHIDRVITDSRQVTEGDLYIPLVGERFDGHDFCEDAFGKGAVLAFTSREDILIQGRSYVLVADTRIALGRLAKWYRSLFDIPFIAVTGSVGKTSSKEMMASILGTRFKVHKTGGNFNNDIGLPLTLLGLEPEHEVAVIEMGMNHFGEIDYLAEILKPTMGMIVNIGVSHIEFLGSRDGILKAKTEMLPHIKEGGMIILNGDDDRLVTVDTTGRLVKKLYGKNRHGDCIMVNHRNMADGGQKMTASTDKGIYNVSVDYPGEHILHNALGCILAAEHLGMTKDEIEKGIRNYTPAGMRLNAYHLSQGITVLDDAYNASVDSMASALKTMAALKGKYNKTVALLGSMFEMGSYAETGHRQVGVLAAEADPDLLITVGHEAGWISEEAKAAGMPADRVCHYERQEDLLEEIGAMIGGGTLILLKASRGMHLEKTRDRLIESFEE